MAVLWLSGSAEPGASVNVAPREEKSLCPGLWETETERGGRGGGERRGPQVVGKEEREREPLCLLKGPCKG